MTGRGANGAPDVFRDRIFSIHYPLSTIHGVLPEGSRLDSSRARRNLLSVEDYFFFIAAFWLTLFSAWSGGISFPCWST